MHSKTTKGMVDDVLGISTQKTEAVDTSLTPGLTSWTMSQAPNSGAVQH
jgi:hypothetical protein